ncbi:MAG: phospholipid/cholesterol/gamma-HCH transport system substrate-binding protein [Solirubrobacteraceae bacterium]|nr:phospholipid/cholesterol/gamma-HCH transport system substrate-binding protein [Solirubrobacteraceae bacterium]
MAAVAVAVVLLGNGGGEHTYTLHFQNAAQLVKGNLVQVSGRPVGDVRDITLSDDGQAAVKIRINQDGYALRQGTRAIVRASSLSGIANRYIDLQLPPGTARKIPEGGTIPAQFTTTAVDLDEIFNVFDPSTRKGLVQVIRGFATTYAGKSQQANAALAYLNPSFAATSRLFRELSFDKPELRKFITESASLVTDIAQRRADLAGLIVNLNATTAAIGAQRDALAEAIQRLPDFMRRANSTFVNLRQTLKDLTPLVNESKPVAKQLRPFVRELRPLARNARPTIRDLSNIVRRAGGNNDLTELTRTNVPVANIALGPVNRNGKSREGAFPAATKALAGATPELAFGRPYAPDVVGWFNDFSQTGYYDANGSVGRVALHVSAFTTDPTGIPQNPIAPNLVANTILGQAQLNQTRRCPGSMERPRDGSSPITNGVCDPNQVPSGP